MAELRTQERELLEEAASWRLLGLAFERPRGDWAETIRAVAEERAVDRAAARVAARATEEGTEAVFLAAFGPGGAVSPREVSYRRMGDPGRILAELKVMYDAFTFIPQTEEPPDHISVEIGFVGFLRLKEAYALMMDEEEAAEIIRKASDLFVTEHLTFLVAGLRGRLSGGYLREALDALSERIGPVPSEVEASVNAVRNGEDFDCASGCSFGAD